MIYIFFKSTNKISQTSPAKQTFQKASQEKIKITDNP